MAFPPIWYPEEHHYPVSRRPAINPYVAQLTYTWLNLLTWAIIARSLLSWFPVDQSSTLYQMLHRVTEPIIEPIRRYMPSTGMMDMSPLMAIIALLIMQMMVGMLVAPE